MTYPSRNLIKLLAIIFMVIDHIGMFLLNDSTVMRAVGRLSFPLFVFLLADGFQRTHNLTKYAKRLLTFWAISIVPYSMAVYNEVFAVRQNIFLSLYIYLGLYCLLSNDKVPINSKIILTTVIAVECELLQVQYGWYGVALAVIIYQYKQKINLQTDTMVLLLTIGTIQYLLTGSRLQLFAAFSVVFISPNGELSDSRPPDKLTSLFAYVFYPLHLTFLALL